MERQPKSRVNGPIFIVGTGRSGTTLVASILDSHSRVSCGPETGFFVRLPPARQRELVEDPAWPKKAVRYLMKRERVSGKIVEQYGLDEEALRSALQGRTPSIQAVLEAVTVTFAKRRGRERWAEKTPTHVLHVREIRALWPDAAIVQIVRDPRGVAASHLHVPWGPRTIVGAAFDWEFQDDWSSGFMASDAHSMTLKYEDLMADTEKEIRRLCDFIDEPFEPTMLDPDRGVGEATDVWKSSRVIDAGRANAWQTELSALDQSRVTTICAAGMRRHGYQGATPARTVLYVQPHDQSLDGARGLLEEASDRGIVLQALRRREWRSGRDPVLFYGGPRRLRWTQRNVGSGLRTLAWWARTLGVARLRGRTLLWVDDRDVREPVNSWTERACDAVLRLAASRSTPTAALDRVSSLEAPGKNGSPVRR